MHAALVTLASTTSAWLHARSGRPNDNARRRSGDCRACSHAIIQTCPLLPSRSVSDTCPSCFPRAADSSPRAMAEGCTGCQCAPSPSYDESALFKKRVPCAIVLQAGTAVPDWKKDKILCGGCFCYNAYCFAPEGCCTQDNECLCCTGDCTCCDTMPTQFGFCTCCPGCVVLPAAGCCVTPRALAQKVRMPLPSSSYAFPFPPALPPSLLPSSPPRLPSLPQQTCRDAHAHVQRSARAAALS